MEGFNITLFEKPDVVFELTKSLGVIDNKLVVVNNDHKDKSNFTVILRRLAFNDSHNRVLFILTIDVTINKNDSVSIVNCNEDFIANHIVV